jgi:hypothetical protein
MSSPFQQKFMAKNPVKGFTMDQLEKSTKKAEEQMKKNAAILPQIEGPGNPDYESTDPQRWAGDDGYDDSVEKTQVSNGSVAQMASPLNAYVSTAGHFQRLQDNIAAAFTPKKKTGPTSEDKKNKAMEDYYKSLTKTSEENNPFKDRVNQIEDDSSSNFDVDLKYDSSANYSRDFKDSKERNPYNIGQGVDKSENYFNRFGQ